MARATRHWRNLTLALLTGSVALLAAPDVHAAGKPTRPGDVVKECHHCPELVVLAAGSFIMGSPPSEPEREDDEPQRKVTLPRPFALARTAVTWNQWEACVRDNWCEGPAIDIALRTSPDGTLNAQYKDYGRGTRPAVGMSWYDAQRFVGWLNWKTRSDDAYRLPSEAEWEYAARAGTTTAFPWGNTLDYDRGNFGLPGHGVRGPYARRQGPLARRDRARRFVSAECLGSLSTCTATSSSGPRTATSRISRMPRSTVPRAGRAIVRCESSATARSPATRTCSARRDAVRPIPPPLAAVTISASGWRRHSTDASPPTRLG